MNKYFNHKLKTIKKETMINITHLVEEDIQNYGAKDGIVLVYCPHTTSGITINENADPHVVMDLLYTFRKVFPANDPNYLHLEGNSHAHVKSVLMGNSVSLILDNGKLVLGHWQDIFFCDFDGPREREFFVKILKG